MHVLLTSRIHSHKQGLEIMLKISSVETVAVKVVKELPAPFVRMKYHVDTNETNPVKFVRISKILSVNYGDANKVSLY